jgi:hypothetical protein
MATVAERREAVLVTTLAVALGTEAGPAPYRPAPPRAGSRGGWTLGILQRELVQPLLDGYVAAVAEHAAARGMTLEAAERADAAAALAATSTDRMDLPPRFRQAALAFGDGPQGEAWIHAAIDVPAIEATVDAALRVLDAAAAAGRAVAPRTRPEVVAMVAKLAVRGGPARIDQLVEAIAAGAFTGVLTAAGRRIDCPAPRPGAPLSADWIDGFVRRLDHDGARSWLAEGVAHARRQAKLFLRVLDTAAGAELIARLAPRFTATELSPRALREHAGLAALVRWTGTGRVAEKEIAAARQSAAEAAPAPSRRPVLRVAPRMATATS